MEHRVRAGRRHVHFDGVWKIGTKTRSPLWRCADSRPSERVRWLAWKRRADLQPLHQHRRPSPGPAGGVAAPLLERLIRRVRAHRCRQRSRATRTASSGRLNDASSASKNASMFIVGHDDLRGDCAFEGFVGEHVARGDRACRRRSGCGSTAGSGTGCRPRSSEPRRRRRRPRWPPLPISSAPRRPASPEDDAVQAARSLAATLLPPIAAVVPRMPAEPPSTASR